MSGKTVKLHEPTAEERAVAKAHLERRRRSPSAPGMRADNTKARSQISVDHPDQRLGQMLIMEAIGTADAPFYHGLMTQLANAGSAGGKVDEDALNFMLSVVKGMEPRDQLEAMLAAQMAAVHMATMSSARRLSNAEYISQKDSAERAFNKLARTFTTQVEALKRYRTGGKQTVRVERVTVNEGGQAIVGNVEHPGGGASPKSEGQPHAKQLTHAPQPAMPSQIEAERETLPGSSGQG